jgi:inner membrane protein involved in colicin E2 resistance
MSDAGIVSFELEPGRSTWVEVGYASRGRDAWVYRLGSGVAAVSGLQVHVATNFNAIDFPAQTLLPTKETQTRDGWDLQWNYSRLLTSNAIGVTIPAPLQPGPLAGRITFWAPVALLFYFFVMLIITKLRGVDLHPVNYFFLACAFFAFHLLFGYLVDRVSIGAAFAICSLVSIFLSISYLRLVVGWRFAAVESGLAQFVYLVLFSFALFNEGWSGLTITVGAIVTLFVAMQVTARIRWA